MNGLITHEESQVVTQAFLDRGHFFISNDLQSTSGKRPDRHFKADCFRAIEEFKKENGIDFLGCHPDCTFLTNAGVRWIASKKPRAGYEWSEKYHRFINWARFEQMKVAAYHFLQCLQEVKKVGKGYIENPIMHRYAQEIIGIGPSQIIQPWMFGTMQTKATCLWLINLPNLEETNNVYTEMMKLPYKDRAKVHYESPSKNRAKNRSKTDPNIAKAFARQWG